ncbi:MAG: GPGG-motif small membrane protein [Actinomycetota bacterium]
MGPIIWLLSVVLAIVGIIQLLQGQLLFGILLLVLAAMVGPGGYSIFRGRSTV